MLPLLGVPENLAPQQAVKTWQLQRLANGLHARGDESLGCPSSQVQNPGAMPIVIPSIFHGLWRILLADQKDKGKGQGL